MAIAWRVLRSTRERRNAERQRLAAPCVHGTVGAQENPRSCEECERIREEEAKEHAANEAADRHDKYLRHLANIRLPAFLKGMNPFEFQTLVCRLYEKMGFEVEHTRLVGDNGADGLLRKNGQLTILQAKRVQGSVGEPVLRDLFGTMHSFGASHGVVVTTGRISQQARAWARGKPIELIELDELISLIETHLPTHDPVPPGFSDHISQTEMCPTCHARLVRRRGKHGAFIGCSAFPSCRFTRKAG